MKPTFINNIRKTRVWGKCRHIYYESQRLIHNSRLFLALPPVKRTKDRSVMVMCYSIYGGGAERVASLLASGFSDTRDVTVVIMNEKDRRYPLPENVEVICIPQFYGPVPEQRRLTEKYIRTIKSTRRPDASISLMFAMNRLNVRTKGKEAVICSERNNPVKREPDHMPEIRELYRKADHVVFQSNTVRNLFDQEVRDHSTVLPNPVSIGCARGKDVRHRIVNVGRLNPQKNQAMLLRAFAGFHESHPEYSLSLYGEGPLNDELTGLAVQLGIKDSVIFHGNVTQVHQEIADAEMFVLSSDYEGLSNALLECMMMGFPCISTKCEGSVDVIENGVNGLLTEIGDEKDLTEAMLLLSENDEYRERLGLNAAETAKAFAQDNVIRQWTALVDQFRRK